MLRASRFDASTDSTALRRFGALSTATRLAGTVPRIMTGETDLEQLSILYFETARPNAYYT